VVDSGIGFLRAGLIIQSTEHNGIGEQMLPRTTPDVTSAASESTTYKHQNDRESWMPIAPTRKRRLVDANVGRGRNGQVFILAAAAHPTAINWTQAVKSTTRDTLDCSCRL